MAMMNQGDGSTDSLLFLSQTSFSLNRFAVRFFLSIFATCILVHIHFICSFEFDSEK
jgi:hypothetical protein